jgi:hypothetical protein
VHTGPISEKIKIKTKLGRLTVLAFLSFPFVYVFTGFVDRKISIT